jgi:hypothetical protein
MSTRVKDALQQLADMFPSVRGLMNLERSDGRRVGNHWRDELAKLDIGHVEDVIDEYARCVRPLPEGDRVIFEIMEAVKSRMFDDQERLRVMELREQSRKMPWRDGAERDPTCQAVRYIMSNGPVSPERLKELQAWGAWGGPKPEWIGGEETA